MRWRFLCVFFPPLESSFLFGAELNFGAGWTTVYPSLTEGRLGCFQFGAFMKKAAASILA